jgi:hypothetical protein
MNFKLNDSEEIISELDFLRMGGVARALFHEVSDPVVTHTIGGRDSFTIDERGIPALVAMHVAEEPLEPEKETASVSDEDPATGILFPDNTPEQDADHPDNREDPLETSDSTNAADTMSVEQAIEHLKQTIGRNLFSRHAHKSSEAIAVIERALGEKKTE